MSTDTSACGGQRCTYDVGTDVDGDSVPTEDDVLLDVTRLPLEAECGGERVVAFDDPLRRCASIRTAVVLVEIDEDDCCEAGDQWSGLHDGAAVALDRDGGERGAGDGGPGRDPAPPGHGCRAQTRDLGGPGRRALRLVRLTRNTRVCALPFRDHVGIACSTVPKRIAMQSRLGQICAVGRTCFHCEGCRLHRGADSYLHMVFDLCLRGGRVLAPNHRHLGARLRVVGIDYRQ